MWIGAPWISHPPPFIHSLLWIGSRSCHRCPCWRVHGRKCQRFIRNRSADGPLPLFGDEAKRRKAHLCHDWHFNLLPLAVLFPSIAHRCIRTNVMGQRRISAFNSIDRHLWLRLFYRCSAVVAVKHHWHEQNKLKRCNGANGSLEFLWGEFPALQAATSST